MKNWFHVVICLLLASTSFADEWGTISGQIVVQGVIPDRELLFRAGKAGRYAGVYFAQDCYANDLVIDQQSRGLKNCFVYLYKTPSQINDEGVDTTATVSFGSKNCRYEPHALIVRVGQTVEWWNSAPFPHSPRTSGLNVQMGILVAPRTDKGEGFRRQIGEKELLPVRVKCDYHPWMTAYWLVVEHPYAAVTNEKGEFTIKNLPVGDHEFRVWHERCGWLTRNYEVHVSPGSQKLPDLKVDIQQLVKQ